MRSLRFVEGLQVQQVNVGLDKLRALERDRPEELPVIQALEGRAVIIFLKTLSEFRYAFWGELSQLFFGNGESCHSNGGG